MRRTRNGLEGKEEEDREGEEKDDGRIKRWKKLRDSNESNPLQEDYLLVAYEVEATVSEPQPSALPCSSVCLRLEC